ncbi:MoaD/ThiS family protein [Seonamhaeicola algicola]|uniref:MoaD/ThiS family protein n=1 Tax=Seonamhaeicola algicola TaxID=1719036 RepID=A0A5C7BAU3_9FLAO|nr:MoaD/ThiS family protein [Seonamhaeicola algicola]TXE15002.1 MoaD/ThiS family protein [Seonamhaeicola algicola]
MNIKVKYFGQIVDATNTNEELVNVNGEQISDLLETLNNKYSQLKNKDFKIAQNKELVSLDTKLNGSEIALLPPFSGG